MFVSHDEHSLLFVRMKPAHKKGALFQKSHILFLFEKTRFSLTFPYVSKKNATKNMAKKPFNFRMLNDPKGEMANKEPIS